MSRKRKIPRTAGDIVGIPLGNGQYAFAWVLSAPLMAFFDYRTDGQMTPDAAELANRTIAFRIWVVDHAVTAGRWTVVGHRNVPNDVAVAPWFYKQDPLSKALSMTQTGTEEVPASAEECSRLERAAVWEPEHVEDRLRDHFAGRPNKWVQSMTVRS